MIFGSVIFQSNEQLQRKNTERMNIMPILEIKDLHVKVNGKEILKGIDLELPLGQVHVLMGQNGSGKSTLALALLGHPKYEITQGKILLDGEDITFMAPDQRARRGLFLSFQHPIEVSGVTVEGFLRMAYNSNAADPEKKKQLSVVEFHKLLLSNMDALNIDHAFCRRYLNEGFSGGEKKRMEMLQMRILDPKYALLDETDSGLDVDALKIVSASINSRADANHATLIITHFSRMLEYVEPSRVHIMHDGRIVKSGAKELVHEIEKTGYDSICSQK